MNEKLNRGLTISNDRDPLSLYESLGGEKAIKNLVEALYIKILTDPILSSFFSYEKMGLIKKHQADFLTMALGGSHKYTGRDLQTAHAKLLQEGLTDRHFDALKKHFNEVLIELGQPHDLVSEALLLIESMRSDVLGRI